MPTLAVILLLAAIVAGPARGQELSPSAPAMPNSAAVRSILTDAIRLGVPLYNGGQAQACVAVYRTALRSIVLLAPAQVDTARLQQALQTAAMEDPQRGAWTLREAMDELYMTTVPDPSSGAPFRLDFDSNASAWYVVNDNVMGGVSRGGMQLSGAGTGVFSGQLSMRNNGGFSSVCTPIEGAALAGYDGVEMRVRGDGRRYTLLAAPASARGSWQAAFRADEEWQTIRVPFETMQLSVRGWRPSGAPAITGPDVGMLGLLIADKQTQPFRLEVEWMRGYRDS